MINFKENQTQTITITNALEGILGARLTESHTNSKTTFHYQNEVFTSRKAANHYLLTLINQMIDWGLLETPDLSQYTRHYIGAGHVPIFMAAA